MKFTIALLFLAQFVYCSCSAQENTKAKRSKEKMDNKGRYHNDNENDQQNITHPDGPWEYFVDGKKQATGYYTNNMKTGEWQVFGEKGHLYLKGNYAKGKMNGLWSYFYPDGSLMSEVNFKDGVKDGITKAYYENKQLRCIVFYRDGSLDSLETVYYPDGTISSRIMYKHGVPENVLAMNDEFGNKLDFGNFKNGTGRLKTYFSDGNVNKDEYFSNYANDGPYIDYYHNGDVYIRGLYLADSSIGTWTFYDTTGQIKKQVNYDLDTCESYGPYHFSKTVSQSGAYVEKMPEFPGGLTELMRFLQRNLRYPPEARENGIQGRVVFQFVIDEAGELSDVRLLRSVGGGCNAEALRVLNAMPNWIPGFQNGEPVKVYYKLPVTFKLGRE